MSSSKKRTRSEAKAAEEDDDAADEDDDMNGEGSPPLPSGRADLERAVQFNPDDEGDDDDDDEGELFCRAGITHADASGSRGARQAASCASLLLPFRSDPSSPFFAHTHIKS